MLTHARAQEALLNDRCVADRAALRLIRAMTDGAVRRRSIAITVGANRSASRASRPDAGAPPTPAAQFRAFVDAFERLGYNVGTLLGELGLHRSDLDDPDTLIPCAVTGALFERAQLMRPLKNLWTRLAAETPWAPSPSSTI